MAKTKVAQKKVVRNVTSGRVYVQASFNNTLITVTDDKGGVISWASAGSEGFRGARKATPYAAGKAMTTALEKAKQLGLKQIEIYIAGVGAGREQAVRAVGGAGLTVANIKDITPIPHNGVRKKKPRRV